MKKDAELILAVVIVTLIALAGILYGIPAYVINKNGQITSSMEVDYWLCDGDMILILSLSGAPIPSPISIPGIPRPLSRSATPGAK